MPEIASWNGHKFVVSPQLIRSFSGLTLKSSHETKDSTSDGQKYVTEKNSNPTEIKLTVELNAMCGSDVKSEALAFLEDARNGSKGYFYMGGQKLVPCQMILVGAEISETAITGKGKWVSCKVALEMKQCSKYDGKTSTSGNGSPQTGTVKGSISGIVTAVKNVSLYVSDKAKNVPSNTQTANTEEEAKNTNATAEALKTINRITADAQATSSTTKKSVLPEGKIKSLNELLKIQ